MTIRNCDDVKQSFFKSKLWEHLKKRIWETNEVAETFVKKITHLKPNLKKTTKIQRAGSEDEEADLT